MDPIPPVSPLLRRLNSGAVMPRCEAMKLVLPAVELQLQLAARLPAQDTETFGMAFKKLRKAGVLAKGAQPFRNHPSGPHKHRRVSPGELALGSAMRIFVNNVDGYLAGLGPQSGLLASDLPAASLVHECCLVSQKLVVFHNVAPMFINQPVY